MAFALCSHIEMELVSPHPNAVRALRYFDSLFPGGAAAVQRIVDAEDYSCPEHERAGIERIPHAIPYQGSKRRLAPVISRYFPEKIARMYEPFSGSAAMSIYCAYHDLAERFVISDSLGSIVELLEAMIERPKDTASAYAAVWEGQRREDAGYFNRIRDRYNESADPIDLLYLICRCVKNAVRFNS